MAAASKSAYDAVLADLRAQRTKLDAAIAAIEALRPSSTAAELEDVRERERDRFPAVETLDGEYAGQSIIDASIAFLRKAAAPRHVSDIVRGITSAGVRISGDQANTVGSILNRRARERGDVHRIGRGLWTLESPALQLDSKDDELNHQSVELLKLPVRD